MSTVDALGEEQLTVFAAGTVMVADAEATTGAA
jgi:hypothetical protein